MAKPALRKISTNNTFNCEIEIQTVRPLDNDKEMPETDALSLIILELNYSRPFDPDTESVQVMRVENSNSYLYVSSLSKFRYHIISSEPVIGS